MTTRDTSPKGSGRSAKKLTKLKMRLLTPTARPRVTTTTAAKLGCFKSCRSAKRTSCPNRSMRPPSLVSQGDHWIDTQRAARGDRGGGQRHGHREGRGRGVDDGVRRAHAHEKGPQQD